MGGSKVILYRNPSSITQHKPTNVDLKEAIFFLHSDTFILTLIMKLEYLYLDGSHWEHMANSTFQNYM